MKLNLVAQLDEMRKGLDLRPDQIDTSLVLPIFVPSSFFALGNWPGPHTRLRAPEVGLTWTVLLPEQSMRYVDFQMAELWKEQGLNWKALALSNLSNRTTNQLGMRQMPRASGGFSALAFMFEDGLGPSRLLFRTTLSQHFPSGYRVAMPEMSCGFAFASDLEDGEQATIQGVIDGCYQQGTRRLSPRSYHPDDLLPADGTDLAHC